MQDSACETVKPNIVETAVKPDISVVVPAYNESESIPYFAEAARAFVENAQFRVQFVFVDDGSSDNTYELLCGIDVGPATAKVVKLSKNYGAHPGIRAGIAHADADYVMVYSMDMPEPMEDIARFYEELSKGYELVYSLREGYKGDFGSRVFAKLVNKYIEPTYPANGLVGIAFGPKIKAELKARPEANSSIFFQVFQLGFSRKVMPSHYVERVAGESKWTLRKKLKLFVDSFVMFSFAPIRFISITGFIFALIGFVWALAIVIIKLSGAVPLAAGWPTLMAIVLIGFGITNISLGVIAEYLVRDLDATRGRPAFIVDEVREVELRES